MRTKQLKHFQGNIIELNNCYTHYLFVWSQFELDYNRLLLEKPDTVTSILFTDNTYSNRHNVKLNKLRILHAKTQTMILQSIYLLAYSYFENYLTKLYQLGKELDNSIQDIQQGFEDTNEPLINKLLNRLSLDKSSVFNNYEIDTLEYLRLRRNRIIHRSTKNQGELLTLVNHKGVGLNDYWSGQFKRNSCAIDFRKKELDIFEPQELFDILNLYKGLVKKLDAAFLKKFTYEKFLLYIFDLFNVKQGKAIRGLGIERKRKKFQSYCLSEFNYKIAERDLENLVKD